jgi:hypothetical protein
MVRKYRIGFRAVAKSRVSVSGIQKSYSEKTVGEQASKPGISRIGNANS